MEWEEVSFGKSSDDPLQFSAPESFFDPSLETLDSFPKNLLTDITTSFCYSNSDFSTLDQIDSSNFVKDNDDFRDLIDGTFDESLLSDGSISSVLSSDEIFSQIEICSDLLDENKDTNGDNKLSRQSSCSDAWKPELVGGVSVKPEFRVSKAAGQVSDESSSLLDKNLEEVEFDIAKLKKEVDFTCEDDDSMWSDFFSEDDPSEISKEYDDLLKSLLTTPVDDFDLTLNVFNNVDQAEAEAGDGAVSPSSTASDSDAEAARMRCVEHILSDHCYTLPWEAAAAITAATTSSTLLTPPNSSDDSDQESEVSSHTCHQPRKHSSSDASKFIHKTVKLKHKKDLKFVFSIKVKDKIAQAQDRGKQQPSLSTVGRAIGSSVGRQLQPGRSLLKKNHGQTSSTRVAAASMTSDLVREVLQKRAYRKKYKLNEADLAVQSLLGQARAAGRDQFPVGGGDEDNRFNKMRAEREIHNSMERQRRIELKNEFDKLKSLIPEIAQNDKVSKLNVLNYSADYVTKLEKTDLKLKLKKNNLKEKRQKLMEELSRLSRG